MTDGRFEVRDAERTLRFEGSLIGDSSSFSEGKRRWVEIFIYRTISGQYVTSIVGRTDVNGEQTRHNSSVSETAAGVVESLYLYDSDGVRYLTRVARNALELASTNDPKIKQAFMVEDVA